MTQTKIGSWVNYTKALTIKSMVLDFVGEFENDFDVDAIVNHIREDLNDVLNGRGISLVGEEFLAELPVDPDANEMIYEEVAAFDLGAICEQHERTP